jgi:multisubunit Na+/H+ antiporter MnhE subunit
MTAAPRSLRSAAEWLAHASFSFAAWLAFTGKASASELAAGAIAAAIAGTASLVVWSRNGATVRGASGWLLQAWRLPKYAVTGTWEILAAMAGHLAGRPAPSLLLSAPFEVGGDDPLSRMRRALAVAYTTATPNFVVLGIDRERGLIWYHQLRRSPIPRMALNLGVRS